LAKAAGDGGIKVVRMRRRRVVVALLKE